MKLGKLLPILSLLFLLFGGIVPNVWTTGMDEEQEEEQEEEGDEDIWVDESDEFEDPAEYDSWLRPQARKDRPGCFNRSAKPVHEPLKPKGEETVTDYDQAGRAVDDVGAAGEIGKDQYDEDDNPFLPRDEIGHLIDKAEEDFDRSGRRTTALGRLRDTRPLDGKKGINVMNLPDDEWTPEKNKQWLQDSVDRGDTVLLVSNNVPEGSVYETEIKQLKGQGFNRRGNYMVKGEAETQRGWLR